MGALEMQGAVRSAAVCPHANYVIQRIIEVLPASTGSFVAEELQGVAVDIAQNRAGCRVICRLVEHTQSDNRTAVLLEEVIKGALQLSRHTFGHYAIQSLLEHGSS